MRNHTGSLALAGSLSLLIILACNVPLAPSSVAHPALSPSSTSAAAGTPGATASAAAATPTPTATTARTPVPPPSSTPQSPRVITTAYCWSGPNGATFKYEVISSVAAGTRVQLLGRGILDGWWVIVNPRYHDPCWIQQAYLQIDPAYDLSGLRTFPVPPTPTATP